MLGILTACQEQSADPAETLSAAALFTRHCAGCHGRDGEGLNQQVPPLQQSEWLHLPAAQFVQVLGRGIQGRLKVAGREYQSRMPAQAHLSDQDLALIANYVRERWAALPAAIEPALVQAERLNWRGQGPVAAESLRPPDPVE